MKTLSSADTAQNESVWAATTEMPHCPELNQDLEADVCIVGAGISGLTTGYLLTKAGKKVVIVDDGPLAGGMTEVTTAHLSDQIDDRFTEIEKWHGERGAFVAAESHTAAINRIESIAKELHADCDFVRLDGYLFLAPGHEREVLERELAAARRAGLRAEMVPRTPIEYESGPAIRFPNQARFHPLKYLAAMAQAIVDAGGQIFTYSHADHVEGGDNAKVEVGQHTVHAGSVVVATNSPINDMFAVHTKQAPYMSYVIGARVPAGSVYDALYWDTLRAYHYVRIQPSTSPSPLWGEDTSAIPSPSWGGDRGGARHHDHDVLIIGGEDHKSGQAKDTEQRHARLEAWARTRFPMIEDIEFKWGGQLMETIDGLGFIGHNPLDAENVYIATGDSGMGMTHGTIAGMLLTDLILGRRNSWAALYDPARKTVRAAGNFTKENMNVAGQYLDWITPGEVKSANDIELGGGAVMRRGLSKVAVYRDETGKTHELSAVCPHLGCIVHWNAAESTWDCPCHGSRFKNTGEVINGPSNVGLPPANE